MSTPFSRTTRSLDADSASASILAWLVAGLFLAAWLAWFVFGHVTVYEVSRRARLEVRQAPHAVASSLPGRVLVSHLAIGRAVRAGDTLVELDAGTERLRLDEERARLAAIPVRIASLRQEIAELHDVSEADQRASQAAVRSAAARVREADATAGFAAETERRLAEESGSGSVPEIDALRAKAEARRQASGRDALVADATRLDLDAQTRARQTRVQIEALSRTIATLDGELETARATVARHALEIERHRVVAPVDGTIGEASPVAAGAWITAGQKLATVVPGGDLLIVADFDPASALGRLRPGQSARLRLDGFPWAQYGTVEATVARVSGEIRDDVLRVELAPVIAAGRAPAMQHGLAGVVEVAIERAPPASLLLRASGQRLAAPARPLLSSAEAPR